MGGEQVARDEWLEGVLDRIERARGARGLSQRALGAELEISGSAIAQWGDRDGSFVHWRRLASLADALGVSADWILGRQAESEVSIGVDPREVRRMIRELRAASKIADRIADGLEPQDPQDTSKE
jgi:transcriptional regulator with XRE-family HTH domain